MTREPLRTVDLSEEAIARVLDAQRAYAERGRDHPDERDLLAAASEAAASYRNAVIASGRPGLEVVARFCLCARSDADLSWIGVALVEPLLDLHWSTILPAFDALARDHPPVRRALSCAGLHLGGGDRGRVAQERLEALVGPEDDIGRSPP